MAEKILTAKVRLDAKDAEKALENLAKKIQNIESKIKQLSNNNKLETQLNKQAVAAEKVKQETTKTAIQQEKLNQAAQKTTQEVHKTAVAEERVKQATMRTEALQSKLANIHTKTQVKITTIVGKVRAWASGQKNINLLSSQTNNVLGSITSKLKRIASIYFGIMGAKYAINATDTITKAENKLNYLSAGQLGDVGYNADGSYSNKTLSMTQDAMDKMYASSQKVRMGYGAMMSNVSKMMTLAPDAFQGQTDNAIRFQEIMAESYALGGASAEEMSTSMYQLTQALGAGTLAGDELRSVREGAPLAYKAIEEFAQGIYNTDASLKELGADGKITSDMVVAAIMDMGKEADKAFSKTTQTFEQTWEQIKNAALYAFDPVGDKLRKVLAEAIDAGLIQKIEKAFVMIANTILWILDKIEIAIKWISKNWEKIKPIVVGVLSVIVATFIVLGVIAVSTAIKTAIAWIAANAPLLLIILTLAVVIYMFYQVMTGAMTMSEFLVKCAFIIGLAFLMVGIIINSIPMIIIGVLLLVSAVVWNFFAEICGYANVAVKWIVNAWLWLCNVMCGIGLWIEAVFHNCIEGIKDGFFGCVEWTKALFGNLGTWFRNLGTAISNLFGAVGDNIGISFSNAWTWARNTFWEFVADVIDGVGRLEPVINGIAGLLGKDGVNFGSLSNGIRGKKGEYKEFVDIGSAWSSGMNTYSYVDMTDAYSNAYQGDYWDLSEAWNTGYHYNDVFKDGWVTDAYNSGFEWGSNVKNKVDGFLDKSGNNVVDTIKDKLGGASEYLANVFGGDGLEFPNKGNSGLSSDLGDILDGVNNIDDNTKLTADDLKYLRDVANMEWRKEFTTAEIHVEMNNNNTVNGDSDLDGLVTKLTEKLYEELDAVANGVYA